MKCNLNTAKLIILLTFILISCSKKDNYNGENPKFLSDFFPDQKAQVLVVGTFHFAYPGLDMNKVNEEDKIDILTEPKKSELTELIEYIKKFKPNKIAIEALPSWKSNEKLEKYLNGEYDNDRDERFQIGMRLVKELQLSQIYGIDAESLSEELSRTNNPYLDSIFMSLNDPTEDGNEKYQLAWKEYNDKLTSKITLVDYFAHMNNVEYHRGSYGSYLLKDFKYENQRGADILSIWWYNRNLRIFRKIQEITESEDDRIAVIIGNGHAALLRHLFEASPEYKFIEFESL